MSNGDNFAGGFVAGALLGGILGGVLGATLVSRSGQAGDNTGLNGSKTPSNNRLGRRRRWMASRSGSTPVGSEERIEEARTSLEDKIAQLNAAIDEARLQLSETEPLQRSSVNSRPGQNGTANMSSGGAGTLQNSQGESDA